MIVDFFCQKSGYRGVARGGAEGARAPPEFGRSVNPIQTRGGRLCPSHYCQPPRIQKAIYISAMWFPEDLKDSSFPSWAEPSWKVNKLSWAELNIAVFELKLSLIWFIHTFFSSKLFLLDVTNFSTHKSYISPLRTPKIKWKCRGNKEKKMGWWKKHIFWFSSSNKLFKLNWKGHEPSQSFSQLGSNSALVALHHCRSY